MASLHARHSRACALEGKWTSPGADGCTCKPVFYAVTRAEGKMVRERLGRNRQQADRAVNKIRVAVDEGEYVAVKNVSFAEWGTQWLASLQRKPTTIGDYRTTIRLAGEVFGTKNVRQLGPSDVAAFNTHMAEIRVRRPGGPVALSPGTRAKHLRVLQTCLTSAIAHRYAARNPVREIPKGEKPHGEKRESAYFEDSELARLASEMTPGVFRVLFELSLKTGIRQGEAIALTWGDVDMLEAKVLHVRRTYTNGHLQLPKNHEKRAVDLTPDVVGLLGRWWGECGSPGDDRLVFPGDGRDGYIVNTTLLRREFYPAMLRAGIPRVGPTGEKRTWHSLRHSFAKAALEHGADLFWVSRHLGHSSTAVTDRVYGHFGRDARKAQMRKLENAFSF